MKKVTTTIPMPLLLGLLLLVINVLVATPMTAQNFIWAKQWGSAGNETSAAIATDAAGNVYTTGSFDGTVDFDPGTGVFNMTSTGVNDIYITKIDPLGNLVWAKQLAGASGGGYGYGIAADAAGFVYFTGTFYGTNDFDPNAGTFEMTAYNSDVFICKLSTAGNLVWAKQWGGTNPCVGYAVAVDAAGNVYSTGYFDQAVDFDPGAGTFTLTCFANTRDIFVSKLTAEGNFVWARQMGGTDDERAYSLATDATGNVYTTGPFGGTADFDPGTGSFNLTSVGAGDVFVSKLDASGNFVWAKQWGSTLGDEGRGIVLDFSGNVYSIGYFQNTTDFDPGAGTFNITATGGADIYVSKLDAAGNFVWAKKMGGTNFDVGFSIGVDVGGNIYPAGNFRGTADFDPGAGTFNMTSAGINDIAVTKLDPSGNFVWARQMGGTGNEDANAIAVTNTGSIYATGRFQNTADFDPAAGTFNMISAGGDDAYLVKLDGANTLPVTLTSLTTQCNNGRINIHWSTASENNNDYFLIEKSKDGINFQTVGRINSAGNSSSIKNYSFTDETAAATVSYYRLKQTDADERFKYSQTVAATACRVSTKAPVLYPNPNQGIFTMDGTSINGSIIISNAAGQNLLTVKMAKGHTNIDVRNFPKGIYIIGAITEGKSVYTKMMIE